MLYVTTRDIRDAYTAHRALTEDRAPDGGLFVPFRVPVFGNDQITSLKALSFGERIAQILGLFFPVQLTGWDVDFCIGRNPAKITGINHKVFIAENWHNPESDYAYIERSLYNRLCGDEAIGKTAPEWSKIAIRIAVLSGVLCELLCMENSDTFFPMDVAVDAGDVSALTAVWYVRQMGFPVATIICGCDENSPYSDLFRRGTIGNTASTAQLKANFERLVYTMLGENEAKRYLDASGSGRSYSVRADAQESFKSGTFSAVVGNSRIRSLIDSVRKTNAYTVDACTAIAFGALQDFRATNRENRHTLLIADRSPEIPL